MKPKWMMVRLKKSTHERLKQEVARLCKAMEDGRATDLRSSVDNPNPAALGLTMDDLINRLLADRERHRVRVRRSATKARDAKAKATEAGERG